jgi:hypothetical protein
MLSSSTILQNQLQNYFISFVRNFQKLNSRLFRQVSSNEPLLVPQVKVTIST